MKKSSACCLLPYAALFLDHDNLFIIRFIVRNIHTAGTVAEADHARRGLVETGEQHLHRAAAVRRKSCETLRLLEAATSRLRVDADDLRVDLHVALVCDGNGEACDGRLDTTTGAGSERDLLRRRRLDRHVGDLVRALAAGGYHRGRCLPRSTDRSLGALLNQSGGGRRGAMLLQAIVQASGVDTGDCCAQESGSEDEERNGAECGGTRL